MAGAFRGSARQSPSRRELGWTTAMRWGVALSVPFSAFVVWAAAQAKPSEQTMAAIVSGCFVLGSLYLVYCVFFFRVWWTPDGLNSWHPLGGTRSLRWEQIEAWAYLPSVQAFRVSGGGLRIWYSPMHAGHAALNKTIHRKTGLSLNGDHADNGPDDDDKSAV